ncbi:MAG: transcriptional regulator [Candidatus Omnitrophica bacterium 4484_70.1]|nr:MAG: transcriptional regulator [Candidatus Omnitrophica bacterium 4484_70.1]
MKIPLTDLKGQYEEIKEEVNSAIKETLAKSDFILGEAVNLLEKEIAQYIGVKYAVGVASGTDALVLSLVSLGIGKGDEVITTPFTFVATTEAICRVGASLVFCDVEPLTLNIDSSKIEEKITHNTKAIIPVHLYGMPSDMDKITELAKFYNLKVIEDCAQAFGAEYKNKKVGSLGDCGCFSFFPTKILGGCGDAGMVVTNNQEVAKKIKMLRNHGSIRKHCYQIHGFNSRLDTLQASILRVKLKYIDAWIEKRREKANCYHQVLKGVKGIITPCNLKGCAHSFNYYTIRVKGNKRGFLKGYLEKKGISVAVYYPLCLHLQNVYRDLGYKLGDFPVAECAQNEVLSLPMYPQLTDQQVREIGEAIRKVVLV